MALTWSMEIIDRTGGGERHQEMVGIAAIDMANSVFHPTTSPKPSPSRVRLSFPMATPDLNIRELMEVWAGWKDESGRWVNDPLPFGGYIVGLKETVYGGEKQMDLSLVDYGILLQKTPILGWPVIEGGAFGAMYGYPVDYSVRDWLIGSESEGRPYNGLVNAHLGNGTNFGGVDPIFDTILLHEETLPGIIDVIPGQHALRGHFGFQTLDSAVSAMADVSYFAYNRDYSGGPQLTVGYWMSALAVGYIIVPRFNFSNIADDTLPEDFVVAADADEAAGEIQMATTHYHERDARDVATRVIYKGIGGDVTDTGSGPPPLVYYDQLNPDHAAAYPTTYQLAPGWGAEPILESRLHTVETARFMAEYVEQRAWGAVGRIRFRIRKQVYPGQRIRLRDPNEAQNTVFVVHEATQAAGTDEWWDVTVGFVQPTIGDVIKGGLVDLMLNREDIAWKTGQLAGPTYPGMPKQVPIEMAPVHSNRNWITAGFGDTAALTVQGVKMGRDGKPVSNVDQEHVFRVKPPRVVGEHKMPKDSTWVTGGDGRPHPQVYPMGFSADGSTDRIVVPWDTSITRIKVKGTGTATLNKNGVAAAGPFSPVAGWQAISPAITYSEAEDDDWSVTASGVSGFLSVAVSEP